jgi:hypothetical protein
MSDSLNIYECEDLKRHIEAKAELNEGELTDEDMQAIVQAQTSSMEQLTKLIHYVKFLEGFELVAKAEVERIQARRKTAANRIEGIKRYLLPYVEQRGGVTVGTHRLSTRRSHAVLLADGFNNPQYGDTVTLFKPDKKAIKESIQNGIEVKGAVLEERTNLQIR